MYYPLEILKEAENQSPEDLLDMIKDNFHCDQDVTVKDLEQVAGGNFLPNVYKESEYASVGIKVVDHIIAFDEFWWKGEDIGSNDAHRVVYFYKKTGRVPESVEEAYSIDKFTYTDGGNII